MPPSPCKVCGSNNHWDKECPDWSFYEAKQQKAAYRIETNEEEELESYYSSVYLILIMEQLASENKQASESLDFHKAVLQEEIDTFSREHKSDVDTPWKKQMVFMEEEEDEFWSSYKAKEKSTTHLLYRVGEESNESLCKEAFLSHKKKAPSSAGLEASKDPPREVKDPPSEAKDPLFPPGTKEKLFRIPKARSHPEGMSAIGVSILSTRGFVGGLNNVETNLQMDLCTDITLISHEFYEELVSKPSIKQGMRMRLWQLTDKNSQLKGFVHIPIFMMTVEGDVLEMEAEAYVVPGMMVPILLGEDYQQTYELNVTRNVEEGTHISFRHLDHWI